MSKNKFFNRFMAFALILCMAFSMASVNAFAVESSAPADEEQESSLVSSRSSGDVITAGMNTMTNTVTITLRLGSANWGATFAAGVMGNSGARYEVELTDPNGTMYRSYITGGSNNLTAVVSMLYAPAGTYTFKFTRLSGSAIEATAIAEIHD